MPYQIGSVRIPYSYAATELPYAPDDEEFLHLVNKKYDDEKLVEWEPAPPIHHDPTEPGHLGKPVILPAELKESAKKRFPEHMINVVASDLVSFNRTLPDIRHEKYDPTFNSIQYSITRLLRIPDVIPFNIRSVCHQPLLLLSSIMRRSRC